MANPTAWIGQGPGISVVQINPIVDNDSGTSCTHALAHPTTSGNLLVMAYAIFGNGTNHGSSSDWDVNAVYDDQPGGSSWVQIGSIESPAAASDDSFVGIWYRKNCPAGITKVTNSSTSGTFISSVVLEIGGCSTSAPFTGGEFVTAAPTSASTNPTAGPLTNATAKSILIGILSNNGFSTVLMTPNGTGSTGVWTLAAQDLNGPTSQVYSCVYQIVSSSTSHTHGWTTASFFYESAIAAFHV